MSDQHGDQIWRRHFPGVVLPFTVLNLAALFIWDGMAHPVTWILATAAVVTAATFETEVLVKHGI